MTIAGSKKRSGDSAGIRESKTASANSKDGTGTLKNGNGNQLQSGHIQTQLNPSEMLSQYKHASLEFGSVTKPAAGNGRLTPQDEKDVNQGAYRLARELDQFIAKGLDAALHLAEDQTAPDAHKSGESVADLQLQTARKLRQVSEMRDFDCVVIVPVGLVSFCIAIAVAVSTRMSCLACLHGKFQQLMPPFPI